MCLPSIHLSKAVAGEDSVVCGGESEAAWTERAGERGADADGPTAIGVELPTAFSSSAKGTEGTGLGVRKACGC